MGTQTVSAGTGQAHAFRAKMPRLESDFALRFLTGLAKKLGEEDFVGWCASIFGFDLKPAHYLALRKDLLDEKFPAPKIVLVDARRGGHTGWYDNRRKVIVVPKDFPEAALHSDAFAWDLLLTLIHEFGHHVDQELRTHYSKVGGDAERDEGAQYGYALFNLDWSASGTEFAKYVHGKKEEVLKVDTSGFHAAAQRAAEETGGPEEKEGELEYFGAGMGRGTCSYAHESIEVSLANALFRQDERSRVYFGNWLRDFSQFVDPMVTKVPGKTATFSLQQFKRETITRVVDVLARKKFGEERDPKTGNRFFLVDEDRLGVYAPAEHIDNPLGTDPKNHERLAVFREGCSLGAPELEVDPKTWIKKYIATPGPWPKTSVEYVREELAAAARAGRGWDGYRHFGGALHTLEDLYAHSNFVELSLIELGKKVVPWSRAMPNGHYPMVTGVFATADTIASVGIEAAQMVERDADCTPGKRSSMTEIELLLLEDYDLKLAEQAESVLGRVEELEKDWPKASTFMCRNVTVIVKGVVTKLGYGLHQMANTIDDFQTQFASGPNPDNPTHSQLAKDHDDHPLHVLAARCAMDLNETLGTAMQLTWQGKMAVKDLQDLAASYFVHPHHIPAGAGTTIVLQNVEFLFGSAALTAAAKAPGGPLESARKRFDDPQLEVRLEGHTDNVSSPEFNMGLSQRRAESVRKYLIDAGVAPGRITAVGRGLTNPLVPNTTPANRARNRRVEFHVVKAGSQAAHLQRLQKLISDWAADPQNQAAIVRLGSATFVDEQMNKVKKLKADLDKLSKKWTGEASRLRKFYDELLKTRKTP